VAGLPGWAYALVVLGAVAAVVLGGHFLTRPLFRFIAASRLREIFTAAALLLVVGIALLMTLVDLSPALGTFLAGVVLADSEFRHELESDIEPFKGLLLGLFFITVGAGIDFGVLAATQPWCLGLTLGGHGRQGRRAVRPGAAVSARGGDRWLFALAWPRPASSASCCWPSRPRTRSSRPELASTLSLVVALSMLLTPALFIGYDRLVLPRLRGGEEPPPISTTGTVIIAGIGRFGQIVNRLLVAAGVNTVVLDHEAAHDRAHAPARHPELLRRRLASRPADAAGIDEADAIVVAIDDRERAVQMVEYVRRAHPRVCASSPAPSTSITSIC
jgi:CPA2 family monovalent cation:H+ antiporter-2